jgi:hypothetical protein
MDEISLPMGLVARMQAREVNVNREGAMTLRKMAKDLRQQLPDVSLRG